jgi:hypothetical protein
MTRRSQQYPPELRERAVRMVVEVTPNYDSRPTCCSVGSTLWVPETRCTSRDLLILVEQAAEPVSSSEGAGLDSCALGQWS